MSLVPALSIRPRNVAICPRVTAAVGQNSSPPQPLVIPLATSASMAGSVARKSSSRKVPPGPRARFDLMAGTDHDHEPGKQPAAGAAAGRSTRTSAEMMECDGRSMTDVERIQGTGLSDSDLDMCGGQGLIREPAGFRAQQQGDAGGDRRPTRSDRAEGSGVKPIKVNPIALRYVKVLPATIPTRAKGTMSTAPIDTRTLRR